MKEEGSAHLAPIKTAGRMSDQVHRLHGQRESYRQRHGSYQTISWAVQVGLPGRGPREARACSRSPH